MNNKEKCAVELIQYLEDSLELQRKLNKVFLVGMMIAFAILISVVVYRIVF